MRPHLFPAIGVQAERDSQAAEEETVTPL